MDVTSLLNFSNVAAEQRKQEARQAPPSRNRTPWDAGGYSLPINTLNHTAISPITSTANESGNGSLQIHSFDSQSIESAKSPCHKSSDSRSSLSSFTSTTNSTTNSTTHSRFSSMSTVNSIHPFSFGSNSNIICGNSTDSNRSSESSTTPQIECHSAPASPTDIRGLMPSPTESLDALAALAEQQQASQCTGDSQKYRSQSMAAVPSITNLLDETESIRPIDTNYLKRSGSPSDLMLIPRSNQHASSTKNGERENDSPTTEKSSRLSSFSNASSSTSDLKTHKRTSSAPIFPRNTSQPSHTSSTSVTPASDLVPLLATEQPDVTSPVGSAVSNMPGEDVDAEGDIDPDQPPKCMYTINCDTGSQPRKAISHIFGRNKMCTRLIPQSVWVHYCRKHYQRSRYRNPKEYAKLQCALVQQQIRRVHDWSQQNMANGYAGTVQDWGLAVRKREQKRLDELNGNKRKRRAPAQEDEDDDDEAAQANLRPATAVPDWLLGLCGKGYSTEEILSIFNRLHTEILEDLMPCFPDIEILPNIIVDQQEPKSPKGYAKRKPANIGHKRSQSLGVGLGSGVHPPQYSASPDRRLSQPVDRAVGYGNPVTTIQEPHLVKRRRTNQSAEEPAFHLYPANPTFARHSQTSHRPQFSRIDENRPIQLDGRDSRESSPMMHSRSYAQSITVVDPPLPAPVPQRLNSGSVAQISRFENGGEYTMGVNSSRPGHQRSRSEMVVGRGGMHYSMPGAMHYNQGVEFTIPRYQNPQFGGPRHHYYDERQRQQSYGGNSHLPAPHHEHGHMRHSSSPMNHLHLQQHAMSSARGSHTPLPQIKYERSPPQSSKSASARRHD
ncbi:orp1 like protein [Rutstroemia sp. NJR-2017a BVV2]|nr:orp1 like protein [Rutstroemia sp. NJR-2017a BVV2]